MGDVQENKRKTKIGPLLDRGGNIIISPDEIAGTFADHYANISKIFIRKANQGKTEIRREKINYHTTNHDKKTTTRDTKVPARYV